MKNKFLMLMFLLSTQAFLVNCAKSSDSAPVAAVAAAGACTAGYVSTTAGCLPLSVNGQCQAGYGYSPQFGCVAPSYNNGGVGQTCQAGYVGTVVGCLPQGVCPMNYGFYQQQTYTSSTGQTYQSSTGFCFARSY